MKVINTLIFVLFYLQVFAQPGPDVIFPVDINANVEQELNNLGQQGWGYIGLGANRLVFKK